LSSFTKRALAPVVVACALVALAPVRLPGQGAGDIVLGMSAAFSGPSAELGRGIRTGVELVLKRVNDSGGIGGRRVRLVALDDSYQADPVKDNMLRLIDREQAVAVIGNVGTAGATVAVPIANEKKVLLFGTYSGADLLRKTPPDRYVINLRASYAEETSVMVRGLFRRGIKPQEIAFFTQNDGYGDSGFNGAVKALNEAGFQDTKSLAHGRYGPRPIAVERGRAAVGVARGEGQGGDSRRHIRRTRGLNTVGEAVISVVAVPERLVGGCGRAQQRPGPRRGRRDRLASRAALRRATARRARVP